MATQTKYHQSADGQYRPCGATKRPCPKGEHYTRTQLTHLENTARGRTAVEALQEAQRAGINTAKPHWRLHLSKRTGKLTPICLNQFDYRDYEPSRIHPGTAFNTVDEARQAIRNIEPGNPEGTPTNQPTTPQPQPAPLTPGAERYIANKQQTTREALNNSIRQQITQAGITYPSNWNELGSSEKDLWEERALRVIARKQRTRTP